MPIADDIAHWKNQYATLSDEQLIAEKHQFVEHSDRHIAAVQLLHDRQQLQQQKAIDISRELHAESLRQEKVLHQRTQAVAWLAFLASVAGILVPLWHSTSSKSSQQSTPPVQQAPTALPLPPSNSEPQATKPLLAKQPTKHLSQ